MTQPRNLAAAKKKIFKLVDREELVRITCDLVNIPSPIGSEKVCANDMTRRCRAAGIKVRDQSFEETRANAIGLIKGDSTGACLMLNGHMDASYVGDEQYLSDVPGYRPHAARQRAKQ